MNFHSLKTDPIIYDLIVNKTINYSIRFNDRDFKIGDVLELKKTNFSDEEMKKGKPLIILDKIHVVVTHVLHGPLYGLKDGWVIMNTDLLGNDE